jgi:hypothetical protein
VVPLSVLFPEGHIHNDTARWAGFVLEDLHDQHTAVPPKWEFPGEEFIDDDA